MKCACKSKECPIELYVSDGNLRIKHSLFKIDGIIYVDPNSIVQLINELKQLLRDKTND
jgi:hypothetical protein